LVRDIKIFRAIQSYSIWVKELRTGCRPPVSTVPWGSVASNRGDDSRRRIYLPDAKISPIGDIKVSGSIEYYSARFG
jgi:hypothetical protein